MIIKQLAPTKGKSIEVPEKTTQYIYVYHQKGGYWQNSYSMYHTPENALDAFLHNEAKHGDVDFYMIVEIELPFIKPETE